MKKATQKKAAAAVLTPRQAAAVLMVRNGADIYGYGEAGVFREIEKLTGRDVVQIVKAMDPPKSGAERQPYFGVIATKAGIALAKKTMRLVAPRTRWTAKTAGRFFDKYTKQYLRGVA